MGEGFGLQPFPKLGQLWNIKISSVKSTPFFFYVQLQKLNTFCLTFPRHVRFLSLSLPPLTLSLNTAHWNDAMANRRQEIPTSLLGTIFGKLKSSLLIKASSLPLLSLIIAHWPPSESSILKLSVRVHFKSTFKSSTNELKPSLLEKKMSS